MDHQTCTGSRLRVKFITILITSLTQCPLENNNGTRMHSSRMRTGRSLTVCCSLLPGGGVPGLGRVCSGGGAWSGGVCLVQGGGLLLGGGVCSGGGWVGIPACTEADTPPPPPVDRHTLVKYYLGPTSLRPVTTGQLLKTVSLSFVTC